MKLKIKSEILGKLISKISGGLGTATIGMQSIKIVAVGDVLTLYTNNYQIGYKLSIKGVDIKEDGDVVVSGDSFMKVATMYLSDTLEMVKDKSKFHIMDGTRKVSLSYEDTSDFTEPSFEGNIITTIGIDSFKKVLKIGSSGSASPPSPEGFDCICFRKDHLASTNRERIIHLPFNSGLSQLLLPITAVKEIQKMESKNDIEIYSNGSSIFITTDDEEKTIILGARITDVPYPDIESLINSRSYDNFYVFNLSEILNELTYMSMVSDNKEQVCRIMFYPTGAIKVEASAYLSKNVFETSVDYDLFDSEPLEENVLKTVKLSDLNIILKAFLDNLDNSFVSLYIDNNENTPLVIKNGDTTALLSSSIAN